MDKRRNKYDEFPLKKFFY